MEHFLPILAADDDGIGKIVFPIIFVLIWIASAIASAINKSKEKERRRRLQQQFPQPGVPDYTGLPQQQDMPRQAPPPLPDAIRRQIPNPMPAPVPRRTKPKPQEFKRSQTPTSPKTPQQRKKATQSKQTIAAKLKQQADRLRAMAQRQQPQPTRKAVIDEEISQSPVQPAAAPREPSKPAQKTPAIDASALRGWMRPETLRQQFILTEILQPPKSLRDGN